jgi:hypothetical protein
LTLPIGDKTTRGDDAMRRTAVIVMLVILVGGLAHGQSRYTTGRLNVNGTNVTIHLPKEPTQPLPYQQRGTRTDMAPTGNFQLPPQKPSAVMTLPDKAAYEKMQRQNEACKEFVNGAKQGAYDGRWSQKPVGQAVGVQNMIRNNKAGEQCPPWLLKSKTPSEWQK